MADLKCEDDAVEAWNRKILRTNDIYLQDIATSIQCHILCFLFWYLCCLRGEGYKAAFVCVAVKPGQGDPLIGSSQDLTISAFAIKLIKTSVTGSLEDPEWWILCNLVTLKFADLL